jgi:hypothetical protein
MAQKEDVVCPRKIDRVLRSTDRETSCRQQTGRLDEQLLQGALAVLGVRP